MALNESRVEPPVDSFRLEVGDEQAHLFNKSKCPRSNVFPRPSSNQLLGFSSPTAAHSKPNHNGTYVIELSLPRGEHKVNIFAHNPVGWSQSPQGSYYLTVVSGAFHQHAISAHVLAWVLVSLVWCSFRV